MVRTLKRFGYWSPPPLRTHATPTFGRRGVEERRDTTRNYTDGTRTSLRRTVFQGTKTNNTSTNAFKNDTCRGAGYRTRAMRAWYGARVSMGVGNGR
jgi:hypothetical protein